jgi:hypothetical protein
MEASHRNSIRNTSAARRQSFECFSPPQAKLCTLQSDVGGAQYGAARRRRSSTRLSPPQAESSARPQPAAGGALHASARRRRRAPHAHSPPQAELCTPQPAAGGGSSACTQPVATGGLSTPLSPALSAQEPAAGGAPSAVRPAAGGALRARTRRRRSSARSPARRRRRSRVPARHSSPQRAASPLARRIYSPAAGEDRFAPTGAPKAPLRAHCTRRRTVGETPERRNARTVSCGGGDGSGDGSEDAHHEGRRANSDARDRYLRSKRVVAASTFAITFRPIFCSPRSESTLCWVFCVKRCRRTWFGGTLARSCAERSCATTTTKNVPPSRDRMESRRRRSRWTPRRRRVTSATCAAAG